MVTQASTGSQLLLQQKVKTSVSLRRALYHGNTHPLLIFDSRGCRFCVGVCGTRRCHRYCQSTRGRPLYRHANRHRYRCLARLGPHQVRRCYWCGCALCPICSNHLLPAYAASVASSASITRAGSTTLRWRGRSPRPWSWSLLSIRSAASTRLAACARGPLRGSSVRKSCLTFHVVAVPKPPSHALPAGNNSTGFANVDGYVVLLGLLGALFSFSGYEAGAHLAEETRGARRSAPIGIVLTCVISALVGFWYLLGLVFNLPPLLSTSSSSTTSAASSSSSSASELTDDVHILSAVNPVISIYYLAAGCE